MLKNAEFSRRIAELGPTGQVAGDERGNEVLQELSKIALVRLAHEESKSGPLSQVAARGKGESVRKATLARRSGFDFRQARRRPRGRYSLLSPAVLPVFGLTKCSLPHARHVTPTKTSPASSDASSSGAKPCTRAQRPPAGFPLTVATAKACCGIDVAQGRRADAGQRYLMAPFIFRCPNTGSLTSKFVAWVTSPRPDRSRVG
jgi:hypothetical protein